MKCILQLAFIAAISCISHGKRKKYDGYQLLNFELKTDVDLQNMQILLRTTRQVDMWSGAPSAGRHNLVLVAPEELDHVKAGAQALGLRHHVAVGDVQRHVARSYRRQRRSVSLQPGGCGVIDHTNFQDYDEILSSLRQLRAEYPDMVDVATFGQETYMGRKTRVVKLHAPRGSDDEAADHHEPVKPVIFLESGIHAREWASPAATLYAIDKLLCDHRAGDVTSQGLLRRHDVWVVVVANPDGYQYSWDAERLWRKNRRPIATLEGCVGVDLNRNFDMQWSTTGVDPECIWDSPIYPGPSAFSEVESRNLRDLVLQLGDRLHAYFSSHAFSQLLLRPWGYARDNTTVPQNIEELDRVGALIQDAIKNATGKRYLYGTPMQTIKYAASGSSMDWVAAVQPHALSYTIELRPDTAYYYEHGLRGFLLPAEEIPAVGQDLLAALTALEQGITTGMTERPMMRPQMQSDDPYVRGGVKGGVKGVLLG